MWPGVLSKWSPTHQARLEGDVLFSTQTWRKMKQISSRQGGLKKSILPGGLEIHRHAQVFGVVEPPIFHIGTSLEVLFILLLVEAESFVKLICCVQVNLAGYHFLDLSLYDLFDNLLDDRVFLVDVT